MATHTYRPGGTAPAGNDGQLSVNPMFARHGEATSVPKHRLPDGPMDPATAYQAVHDHLMLDGNALNLATFVTTWMEPEADPLMSECFDKNVIDKDEYPQTAELELRCVSMLARLWNPVLHVLMAGPRGLPADPAGVSQHGDLHIRPDRRSWGRSACSPAATNCCCSRSPCRTTSPTSRLRRLGRPAGRRLANARLHLPGQPGRPRRHARRGAERHRTRDGRPAARRHGATAAAAAGAGRARPRTERRELRPRLRAR
jgi:Pyridoxal-dependent decarboxylase conserved domain